MHRRHLNFPLSIFNFQFLFCSWVSFLIPAPLGALKPLRYFKKDLCCPFCSWAQTGAETTNRGASTHRTSPYTIGVTTNQGASTQGVRAGCVGCAVGAQNGRSPTPFRPVSIPHKPHISPPRRQKNKKITTIPCKIKKSDYLCTRFWKAMLSEGGHKRLVP